MSFSSLSPLLLSVLTYSSILGPPVIPVCGLEIILPTVFKSFLKQESMGLVGMGLRVHLGVSWLMACFVLYVGNCILYFQPRNKVDAGP